MHRGRGHRRPVPLLRRGDRIALLHGQRRFADRRDVFEHGPVGHRTRLHGRRGVDRHLARRGRRQRPLHGHRRGQRRSLHTLQHGQRRHRRPGRQVLRGHAVGRRSVDRPRHGLRPYHDRLERRHDHRSAENQRRLETRGAGERRRMDLLRRIGRCCPGANRRSEHGRRTHGRRALPGHRHQHGEALRRPDDRAVRHGAGPQQRREADRRRGRGPLRRRRQDHRQRMGRATARNATSTSTS